VQGHAVVVVPALADLHQLAKPALQLGKLPYLLADRRELRLGGPDDVVGTLPGPGAVPVPGPSRSLISPSVNPSCLARRMNASRRRSSSEYSRNPEPARSGSASSPRRW